MARGLHSGVSASTNVIGTMGLTRGFELERAKGIEPS